MRNFAKIFLTSCLIMLALCMCLLLFADAVVVEPQAQEVHKVYTGLIFVPQEKNEAEEREERLLSEAYAGLDVAEEDMQIFSSDIASEPKHKVDGWMESCTVTYYCCEMRPHICGGGTGITASGREVEAGVSVAVDPQKIPLGSRVFVDYGDGIVHEYRADDTGNAVLGDHIDVAVQTHDEALMLGLKTATVWWCEA